MTYRSLLGIQFGLVGSGLGIIEIDLLLIDAARTLRANASRLLLWSSSSLAHISTFLERQPSLRIQFRGFFVSTESGRE